MMAPMDLQSALSRVFGADDIGAEAQRWLEDCRAENRRLGGDDGQFLAVVIAQVAQITLPIKTSSRRLSDAEPAARTAGFLDLPAARASFVSHRLRRRRLRLWHLRVERCKQILMVIHDIKQGSVPVEPDLRLDHAAKELAILIFGEARDDRH